MKTDEKIKKLTAKLSFGENNMTGVGKGEIYKG